MKICVFGGQYGSEGKGSATEWLAQQRSCFGGWKSWDSGSHIDDKRTRLIVAGENGPNSGHTCSLGKTRNIPAASFYADVVMLGPDTVISWDALLLDLDSLSQAGRFPQFIIHENAAISHMGDGDIEKANNLVHRIASTGSGAGYARMQKSFARMSTNVIRGVKPPINRDDIRYVNSDTWLEMVEYHRNDHWLFECSQGVMLDVNFGRYPYVTSRTTLPRVAIERNGLGSLDWQYFGVYRTFPIRTGGNSGPTGGEELKWEDIGVEPEIATVTKRTRRVFAFSSLDWSRSRMLARADATMFTHLDYIKAGQDDVTCFKGWVELQGIDNLGHTFLSDKLGKFTYHGKI